MNNNNTSLSKELIVVIFKIYFTITILITVSNMVIEYSHTKNTITKELEQISLSFIPSLSSALWNLDDAQREAIVKGVMLLPSVLGVEIDDQDKKTIGQIFAESFDKEAGDSFYYKTKLFYKDSDNKLVHVGNVRLFSNSAIILDRIELGFYMIVVSAMVKSALLIFLFIWAFRLMLNQPLTKITDHVEKINLENIKQEKVAVEFNSNNELNRLQETFNHMLAKISADQDKILSVEHEIQRRLEHEVQLRTEELTEANIRLKELASTDELTKIYNRRMFFEVAIKYHKTAIRNKSPLTFLMLDIDHFKRINDTYGHHIGDEVLKLYSSSIASLLREGDLFGRLGGEEFGVILQESDLEGSQAIAEKIRETVEDLVYEDEECRVTMTTSIGISQLLEDDKSVSDIQKRADEALYEAKNGGRNRWVVKLENPQTTATE